MNKYIQIQYKTENKHIESIIVCLFCDGLNGWLSTSSADILPLLFGAASI